MPQRSRLAAQRLVAVFIFGVLLFNFPLLAVFNKPLALLGIPLLHGYLFVAWLLVIVLMAWVLERRKP